MRRRPKVVRALAKRNGAVMAHTALGAKNFGVDDAKLAAIWWYRTSPLYSDAERVALDFALAAASQPNDVTDARVAEMRRHWADGQVVAILGVVALFGFLNRWNERMATPFEPVAEGVRDRFLASDGWEAGKHAH